MLTAPILPTLLKLAVPNTIAMFGSTLVAVAETSYIGRLGVEALAAMALAWIGAALLPTLTAWAWYAAIGHGDAFVQANFLSILDRGSDGIGIAMGRTSYVQDDITKGRLVVPFKIALPADAGFYLVSPQGRPDTAKLSAFRSWLGAAAHTAP